MRSSIKVFEGINFVGFSQVVSLDAVQNSTFERQVINRAYRLRQTKDAHTFYISSNQKTKEQGLDVLKVLTILILDEGHTPRNENTDILDVEVYQCSHFFENLVCPVIL